MWLCLHTNSAAISRDSADWDQAINYYSQVIKLKPNDYESFCRRGEIYEKVCQ